MQGLLKLFNSRNSHTSLWFTWFPPHIHIIHHEIPTFSAVKWHPLDALRSSFTKSDSVIRRAGRGAALRARRKIQPNVKRQQISPYWVFMSFLYNSIYNIRLSQQAVCLGTRSSTRASCFGNSSTCRLVHQRSFRFEAPMNRQMRKSYWLISDAKCLAVWAVWVSQIRVWHFKWLKWLGWHLVWAWVILRGDVLKSLLDERVKLQPSVDLFKGLCSLVLVR